MALPVSVPDRHHEDQLRRLITLRVGIHASFSARADTLFEMTDALSCDPTPLPSLPYLSLRPEHRRGHGALYQALGRGRVDPEAMRAALTGALDPSRGAVFAVDASGWPRPYAATSPARTHNHDATLATRTGGAAATVPGWRYSWLVQPGRRGSSWVVPADVTRIDPTRTPAEVAVAQIRRLVVRLRGQDPTVVPIVALDAEYTLAAVAGPLADTPVQVVLRLRRSSVRYTDPPPPPPGRGGRPRRHGHRIKLCDPSSWPAPDQSATLPATAEAPAATVRVWHRVHPQPSEQVHEPGNDRTRNTNRRLIHGSLLHIRPAEPGQPDLWLSWSGPAGSFDLHRVVAAYQRRFGTEHFLRFIKQDLAWTLPRFRHPEQADRWSLLVAAAYAQLALARPLVGSDTPWHRRGRQTPRRVKAGFARLLRLLGTPAKPPQPCKPGPGRPKGRRNQAKHPRHPVVKKPNR
jgi:hypothetical protein